MDSVLLYILGVVILVFGLAVSIALHEVGHLVPAKRFGVRVGQYMIGFGPTLFSRRKGETEYGVKAIPLGGYISMAGMFPPRSDGEAPRTASTSFFDTLVQDARDVSAESAEGVGEERTSTHDTSTGPRGRRSPPGASPRPGRDLRERAPGSRAPWRVPGTAASLAGPNTHLEGLRPWTRRT